MSVRDRPRVIGLPTGWREMRYCIVAALREMGDDGPWYSGEVQFAVQQVCGDELETDYRFMGAPYGKAFERAMAELQAAGIVTYQDGDGIRLATWPPYCEKCSHYHDGDVPCRCPDCGTPAPCREHGYAP